jgi:hypothetical protein
MGDMPFEKHELTEAESLWLKEASQPGFRPKIARVALRDKLPRDFDPSRIDRRFYVDGSLTLLGRWRVDPGDPVFGELDRVIRSIRDLIFAQPETAEVSSEQIAEFVALDPTRVAKLMGMLAPLGRFYSSASGAGDDQGLTKLFFVDDNVYLDFIQYEAIEKLLNRQYVRMGAPISVQMSSSATTDGSDVRPNTAFVLMPIDPELPELEDVYAAIVDTCAEFDIHAYRADVIEHQDRITDRILHEIRTCEFLIADLSLERPNVYYEVGFAHALHKKPILYRRKGTRLHFDLSVHNVPEFKNATELRQLMRRRLTEVLGRGPKTT